MSFSETEAKVEETSSQLQGGAPAVTATPDIGPVDVPCVNGSGDSAGLRPEAACGGCAPPAVSASPAAVSDPPIAVPHPVPAQTMAVACSQLSANVLNCRTKSPVGNAAPKAITGGGSPIVSSTGTKISTKIIQVSTSVSSGAGNAGGQAGYGVGLVAVPNTGSVTTGVAPASKVTRVATITQGPSKGAVITLPRAAVPQQSTGPRAPVSTTVQLPANFQIPQGMVLIRSDSGQLMLVSQQALAQAQAQGIVPRPSTGAALVRVPVPQASTSAIIKKPDTAHVIKVPPPPNDAAVSSFQKALNSTGQTGRPALPTPGPAPLIIPAKSETAKTAPTAISAETLENVKKCKNFLVTLIKLASSGTHSAEMANNVKELVRNLLDGKIEPEEFTDRLYTELKSSPQPYLVPFLKRSLPAVRQLTPSSQLFIQQCDPQPAAKPPPAASPTLASTGAANKAQPLKPVQPNRPTQLVIHQPRGVMIKQSVTTAQSVPVLGHGQQAQRRPVPQTATNPTGGIIKQGPLQVSKMNSMLPPQVQKNSFRDNMLGTFRDEDDINDVASMAGVNLSEESARILATNAEHVGSIVRSCRDEPFLPAGILQKRIMDTGKRHGIADVSPDAVSLVSHATQERLRGLLEKLTAVAQHRKISHKDDFHQRQISDTRSQLKFLEQLDRLEKQRKEQEEREILLRVAKSRSNREDPEQLRLKQKAKEMQQLELAQMQQRDANLTALAAIGPRKKRPFDSLGYGSGNEVPGALPSSVLPPQKPQPLQRVTRVCLRDLLFCMEQDLSLRHSLCLYRAFLR
ncbi:transcription initiation factor TFIID subunit 4-like isoform X2 [Brienomyrus brachyistius]|uniref:transcription initiation factor TFIID subunit 4-like isoform X2 n=1 Tax=Brienomyrus brachyistius TaxID=42636 RepID=UPI0020B3F865|nr:transcription initiation factor TFIID subunit 4-like isoform X2 [Brienomyrus brachyistius]